jgi:hypothetical protein
VTSPANEGLSRAQRLVVWIVVLLSAVLQVIAVWVGSAARPGAQPVVFQRPIDYLGGAMITLGYGFVFVVLATRVPHNRVGWIFGAVALVSSISNAVWGSLSYATETIPPRLPSVGAIAWLGAELVPVWAFLVILLALIFPDGRPFSALWARVTRALAVTTALAMIGIAFGSGPIPQFGIANPLALPSPAGDILAALGAIAVLTSAMFIVPAIWSLVVRYRQADRTGRLQLKWFAYAAAVFGFVGAIFVVSLWSAFGPGSTFGSLIWLAFCAASMFIPVAASIAILRYRLYEIDSIIGRTFVYAALTAILAGFYAAGIRAANWLFVEFTGESSDAALVLTTLVLRRRSRRSSRGSSDRSRAPKEPTELGAGIDATAAANRTAPPDSSDAAPMTFDLEDPDVRAFADAVAAIVLQQLEPAGREASVASEGVRDQRL